MREISRLRHSIDSLKNDKSHKVEQVVEKLPESTQKSEISDSKTKNDYNLNNFQQQINDTISIIEKDIQEDFFVNKIPKVKNSIDALNQIHFNNDQNIDKLQFEYDRNVVRIDSLKKQIEATILSGKNKHLLVDYYNELDSLKIRNQEIEELNNLLNVNNKILESELKIKESEYEKLLLYIYFSTSTALLLLILAAIAYFGYKQKKKYNLELSRINYELKLFNEELDRSNEQKGTLLKIIKKELDLASNYVQSLLPKPFSTRELNVEWIYRPSEQLGGDAFGYMDIDKNNFAFYLLDVSGHGVGAALHSVQVMNILQNRNIANVDFANPADVLNLLNSIFQMSSYKGVYFTMWYFVYNKESRILKFSGAGHPPAFLFSNNKISTLESEQIFIGAVSNIKYDYSELKIDEPTSIFVFSDGVFEIQSKDGSMLNFNDFTSLFKDKFINEKSGLTGYYDFAKQLSGLKTLEDDFSILKIDIN
ncbi:hypothetical protein MASR1M45_11620 [Candidatus Kapaibacterium sp.]